MLLVQTLLSEEKNSVLKVFTGSPHQLPKEKWETIIPYVREQFFDLYGIGIKLTKTNPAIQISKIQKGSPADISKKLRKGDAILIISPNNQDEKINSLGMSPNDLIPLILYQS